MPNPNIPKSIPSVAPNSAGQSSAFIKMNDIGDFTIASGKALAKYNGIFTAIGSRDKYDAYETNISVRNQFSREGYEYFRPNETVPKESEDIIAACRNAYRKVGIIRNVIDLMADFGAQGAKLVHPNPTIQKFYRGWWNKIGGKRICERFLNLFYREGVAVVKRTMGKLPKSEDEVLRSIGIDKLDKDVEYEKAIKNTRRNIPLRYNFLNPLSLKAVSPELSQFVGKQLYSLKISFKLRQSVNNPKTQAEKSLVEMLSEDVRTAIQRGDSELQLDPNKVFTYFYKKDDWQTWCDPMTYAIMDDIILLEKMKLADLAALDGAISQVRIWKLGHINESHPDMSFFPNDEAVDKLSDILLSNPGGGAFDIIWGPDIKVEEYKTSVHQFLGKAKYEPVWNSIYAGLGVPPTLTGAASSSGFTNNYISLKTLVQRLEYGRDALRDMWAKEIELVRQAMGFKIGAKVVFDNMVLADEAAEKALMIQLVDRDLLSVETLIERFGELPEFEMLKMKREEKDRKKGAMKPKASPWHTPEKIYEFMKLALQRGYIAPEQTGMRDEFPEEFLDVEPPADKQLKVAEDKNRITSEKKSGVPQQGRPKNSNDTSKRDTRTPKPIGASSASFITVMMWARNTQQQIAEIINPIILQKFNKKSLRALSSEEIKIAEQTKFNVLCALRPFSNISRESIYGILKNGTTSPANYRSLYKQLYRDMAVKKAEPLTIEDERMAQVGTYAVLNSEEI